MSIAPEFKNFVENNDLIQIRSYLANYLVVDQTFATYEEAFKYASERLPVVQKHDGSILESECANWNKEYLNSQLVAVVSNFSEERIEHIKQVIKNVLSKPGQGVTSNISVTQEKKVSRTGRTVVQEREVANKRRTPQSNASTTSQQRSRSGNSHSSRTGRRMINESECESDKKTESDINYSTAMIVGGAVVTTIGIAAAKPVVIGTGVALLGAGVVTKVSGTKK